MSVTEQAAQAEGATARGHTTPVVVAYAPVVITAVVLALMPFLVGHRGFYVTLGVLGLVFAGYAIAFNIIFGSTGQLFLCVGALAGVSAYIAALLSNDAGIPAVLAALVGVAAAGALGALFSWVSVRRQLDVIFVGIVTLAFSLVFFTLAQGMRDLTGGETGMRVAAGHDTFIRQRLLAYYTFLVIVVAFLALYRFLQRSHLGWAFRALRDDEVAAELAGVDVARFKIIAGAIGSAMLGLVGAVYAYYEGFISPQTFAFTHVDVRVIVMVAFGGIGTLLGPVVGAATFVVVDQALRPLAALRLSIYGIVLIVLFLGFRGGVVAAVTGAYKRVNGLLRK